MHNLLENKEIRLRAIEKEDLNLLYKWENDTSIWHLSNTLTPFSKHVLKQYLDNAHLDIYQTKQQRFVIENTEGKAIGLIDLFDFDPFHNRAGIGILIADKYERRKGYASSALSLLIDYSKKVLQLKQLYCNITVDNKSSLNLFEKQGFEISGIKKSWIKTYNGYIDEYLLQVILD
jgi:diamine N-acetyltransferase